MPPAHAFPRYTTLTPSLASALAYPLHAASMLGNRDPCEF